MIGELHALLVGLALQTSAAMDLVTAGAAALYAAGMADALGLGGLLGGGAAAAAAAAAAGAAPPGTHRHGPPTMEQDRGYRTYEGEPYWPGLSPMPPGNVVYAGPRDLHEVRNLHDRDARDVNPDGSVGGVRVKGHERRDADVPADLIGVRG